MSDYELILIAQLFVDGEREIVGASFDLDALTDHVHAIMKKRGLDGVMVAWPGTDFIPAEGQGERREKR